MAGTKPSESHPPQGLRLNRLSIKNYKKLDALEIDFPPPLMFGDMDVLVFGSKNGGGKTSVLECCSLLLLAGLADGENFIPHNPFEPSIIDLPDLLIKSGQKQAVIKGDFEKNGQICSITVRISRAGTVRATIKGSTEIFKDFRQGREYPIFRDAESAFNSILAFSGEPVITPVLMHFNSYRKIQESKPELGMMAEDYPGQRIVRLRQGFPYGGNPVSSFKLEILRSLMGQASLFEGFDKQESQAILDKLNGLISRYCGGTIENLRPLPDNRMDIRIKSKTGGSFSFDGLSSGQKEMIATLFLIWKNTKDNPLIVLIDEPELHLNSEWHGDFIEQLRRLAPQNQYIIATHSEEIFRSVDESRRAVLVPDDKGAVA